MMDVLLTIVVVALVALLVRMRRNRLAGRDERGPQLKSIPFPVGADGEFLAGNEGRVKNNVLKGYL